MVCAPAVALTVACSFICPAPPDSSAVATSRSSNTSFTFRIVCEEVVVTMKLRAVGDPAGGEVGVPRLLQLSAKTTMSGTTSESLRMNASGKTKGRGHPPRPRERESSWLLIVLARRTIGIVIRRPNDARDDFILV